ncbi:MAG: hypothetical protein A3C88_02355 [Candidatus Yanofskybacteria bacterium RIFCSPHIGHO2_02_FULL_50_12]|uniref:Polymerase beta nucleotidyltransferase domain-containing protein n=1 Tax=Candidatus Yanofskybacteria bacterium RIFCSPHIGHO2_02_FULL_50_12 TaxID=1802685 RepID=A0A1F8FX17_9BACT|nr:MAG: hypothetical protein A3C88_02355 [Candidatus Yanofskybacteria bacterium RIFCSPHIGHO2_02_FULL_50_12]
MAKKNKKKLVKKSGLQKSKAKTGPSARDRYALNPHFEFFGELRSLVLKSSPAERENMTRRISNLGRVRLALISGIFLTDPDASNQYDSPADLFIVGDDINRQKLRNFLSSLEAEVGTEIKFALMDKDEFHYRYSMFDRFVRVLLEGPHEKIINKIGL